MNIESITQGKNKSVITANGKEYEFSNEVVFADRLQCGEIGAKMFFEYKEKSDCLLAKEYLFALLARALKSKKAAAEKLRQKGFSSKAIQYALERAEEYALLDDENYARCYIRTYSRSKGRRRLEYELKRQGVADEVIRRIFMEEGDRDTDTAKAAAEKYVRQKGAKASKDKLFRH
ncbi:MAG: regulatory protein RecX, partial [Clostridia bacterium]|nr:regulatory protein RecX [Clostridia bacterium]